MQEKTLMRISFVCSVIGVIALFFLSENIEISDAEIDKIDLAMIGNSVKVDGKVSRVTNAEKVLILNIVDSDNNDLTVVAFKKKNDNINLTDGDNVKITGKIEEYNGKPEIIASEIKAIV